MRKHGGQTTAIETAVAIAVILVGVYALLEIIPQYSRVTGTQVNTFQLEETAQEVLQEILTTPGYPVNWGLNASPLSAFGLAEPGEPYVLDPFKVINLIYWSYSNGYGSGTYCSLNETATGFEDYLNESGISTLQLNNFLLIPGGGKWVVSYDEVKALLGLDGYDFMLTIEPLFNVTVLQPRGSSSSTVVIVKVTRFGEKGPGAAVINATVSLQYLIATTGSDNNNEVIQGDAAASTNASGYARITISTPYNSSSFYYFDAFASLDGYGDHGYYTTAATTPLLMAMILPFTPSYNNITFIDPHLVTNCLLNSGAISNPGQSALGLRIAAVYKSIYGYTFNSINFTLNPGRGNSYPIPCTALQSLQSKPSGKGNEGPKYSACYWSLPTTPLFLVVSVYRNSNGQSGKVPLHEILLIPYGISPQYYLANREIVFGRSVGNAPTGTASSLVQIGDSTYTARIVLYYDGDFLAG